jgi:hypothetical protein
MASDARHMAHFIRYYWSGDAGCWTAAAFTSPAPLQLQQVPSFLPIPVRFRNSHPGYVKQQTDVETCGCLIRPVCT